MISFISKVDEESLLFTQLYECVVDLLFIDFFISSHGEQIERLLLYICVTVLESSYARE